ncbi:hypothetical protein FAIPA1_10551 [Frankia sp. AiPs1]
MGGDDPAAMRRDAGELRRQPGGVAVRRIATPSREVNVLLKTRLGIPKPGAATYSQSGGLGISPATQRAEVPPPTAWPRMDRARSDAVVIDQREEGAAWERVHSTAYAWSSSPSGCSCRWPARYWPTGEPMSSGSNGSRATLIARSRPRASAPTVAA